VWKRIPVILRLQRVRVTLGRKRRRRRGMAPVALLPRAPLPL
jgi:hypothetical protein